MSVSGQAGHKLSKKKAIVMGGRIAGMLAARVLSDFFEEVLIIEKNQKSDKQLTRTGVPQGAQGHALLKSGEEILSELFPGIIDELVADGSVKSDFASELSWHHHGKWKIKFQSGISIIQQSRPFLEWHIQRRLEMIPNINYLYGTMVSRLVLNPKHTHVTGIEVIKENQPTSTIKADWVVDASGAASKTPGWLKLLGYEPPKKTEVKVNLFYASRVYRLLSSTNKIHGSLLVYPNPPMQNRGAGIFPIENGRWMVTLLGYGVNSVPSNEEEFLEYTRTLEKTDVYDAIKNAHPETDISIYRFPALRRFHYEKLSHFPNGLVVMGDAFCRIDPVFGQGMSISAFQAMALKKELAKLRDKNRNDLSKKAHRRFSRIIDVPWLIALTEDFRFAHTTGTKPAGLDFLKWYVKKVILACETNQLVYKKLIDVLHLKAHPIILFSPAALRFVLFQRKK